jgi:hypothetical protein
MLHVSNRRVDAGSGLSGLKNCTPTARTVAKRRDCEKERTGVLGVGMGGIIE